VVDQGDAAHARGRQVQGRGRAQPASTDDQHVGVQQGLLAFDADFVEQDVARVAQELVVVHGGKVRHRGASPPRRGAGGGCRPSGAAQR